MKFVKLDPPGTFCTYFGLHDLLAGRDLSTIRFLEVGCGEGNYSRYLLNKGTSGTSIDFSDKALAVAAENLRLFIETKHIELKKINFMTDDLSSLGRFDVVFSVMVLEHVEDEVSFLKKFLEVLKPGGEGIIIVPSRPECWGVEDDSAGHLRRYTRETLNTVIKNSQFAVTQMNSIGVPVVNLLLQLSNFLVGRSEKHKQDLSLEMKTKLSGTREIPFKTVFPSFFRILLNEFTLIPLKLLQRFFYRTNKGLILGASFRKEVLL